MSQTFKAAGNEVILHTDADASKAQVRLVRGPRVLYLATHGFALEQPGPKTNPWSRCGFLLASVNVRPPKGSDGAEEGVLTGLEIAGLDLYGTELVVLSACDTGRAADSEGEAVLGLRRCFLFAGARGVLATLWPIPDRDTARLMAAFVDNWQVKKMPKGEALRQAQLSTIQSHTNRSGDSHPLFWGAFTLTGDWK